MSLLGDKMPPSYFQPEDASVSRGSRRSCLFNIPEKTASGDGRPLSGWEFRVWSSELGFPIPNSEDHIEQKYQCAVAFFRRTRDTRFVWQTEAKDLETWVQFITLDQLLNVADKLIE